MHVTRKEASLQGLQAQRVNPIIFAINFDLSEASVAPWTLKFGRKPVATGRNLR